MGEKKILSNNTIYSTFLKNIGIVSLANVLVGLQPVLLIPILSKTLSVEDYGMWILFIVTLGLIPPLLTLGLPQTLIRFFAVEESLIKKQDGYNSFLFIVIFVASIFLIIITILENPIANLLFDNEYLIVRLLALAIIVECISQLQFSFFLTFQLIKHHSYLRFSRALFQLLFVTIAVLLSSNLIISITLFLIINIIFMFIIWIMIIQRIGISLPIFTHIKKHIYFGLPLILSTASTWIVISSDRYLIAYFLGSKFVGYYGPAYDLGNITLLYAPFALLLPPMLSKFYDEKNVTLVMDIMQKSIKYYLLLAIPACIGVSVISKPLLDLLSTSEIAINSYFITPFSALSTLLFGYYIIIIQILFLEKKTKIIGYIWIFAAIINLVLNIFLIPQLGITGAALSTLVAFCSLTILVVYFTNRISDLSLKNLDILKHAIKCVILSICIIPIIFLFNPNGIAEIFFTIFSCILLYVMILVVTKMITVQEIIDFKQYF